MKKIALAAAFAVAATASYAGNLEPVVIEPEIIVEETAAGTGAGLIVPLLLVAVIATAVASSN